MSLYRFNSSVLLLSGDGILSFLDGLSTNLVNGSCTAPFTNGNAKIIDVYGQDQACYFVVVETFPSHNRLDTAMGQCLSAVLFPIKTCFRGSVQSFDQPTN